MSTENTFEQNSKVAELLKQASTAYENEQFDQAKMLYDKALSIDTQNIKALYGLARIHFANKDLDATKQLLDQVFIIQPDYPEALVTLGSIYAISNDLKQARNIYEKALKLDPSLTAANHNLGNIYWNDGDYVRAEKAFLNCVKSSPDSVLFNSTLARFYLYQKDYNNAEKFYLKVNQLDSHHQESLMELAGIAFSSEEYELSFQRYLQLQEIIDKFGSQLKDRIGPYYLEKGKCAYHLNEWYVVLSSFLEAVKYFPSDAKLNYAIANAYDHIDLPDSHTNSATYCIKALELQADMDEFDNSNLLISCVPMIPNNPVFWDGIVARLYKILNRQPGRLDIAITITAIYSAQGRYDESLKAVDRFISIFPNEAEFYRQKGLIYFFTGLKEEAKAAFQSALSLDPEHSDVLERLKNL
jgi:tetratricopeptide (TPR) repeat protein